MREGSPERDLDAALAALIERTLRQATDTDAMPPAEQARLLAQALAVGLRELVRAPLREALQAGYDLGWRAALQAQSQQTGLGEDLRPASSPATMLASTDAHLPSAGAATLPAPLPDPPFAAVPTADAEEHAHQVCVEISPLPNFSAVNRFHAAVAGVDDVADSTMVAFRDGRLTLRVEHSDGRALAGALQALDLGPLRIVSATPDRVELVLDDRQTTASRRWRGRDASGRPTARG